MGINRLGFCAIYHKQHSVGGGDFGPGSFYPYLFHCVSGVAQAGCVYDMQWHAIQVDMLPQYIPCGAGYFGDNRRLFSRQALSRLDLPALGRPAITTFIPSRMMAPCLALACTKSSLSMMR